MKIIFMGTPDFSAEVLDILNKEYKVDYVVTGNDKPVGRGYKLVPSPLKEKALELNIPVLQYDKVSREGIDEIKAINPDLIVTCAFGQILSEEFLNIPKYGVLNVHASLLPLYRGSAPIQWAILNGDKKTGITIMKTVKEIDAGDILYQEETEILEKETAGELFDRLSTLGGKAIISAIRMLESGDYKFIPQDNSKATHVSMIKKSDGKIDFNKTYNELDCFIRGMSPWPSAFTQYNGKLLKIFDIEKANDKVNHKIGEIITCNKDDGILVQLKDGEVKILELQLEGSKRMTTKDFLLGRQLEVGYIL